MRGPFVRWLDKQAKPAVVQGVITASAVPVHGEAGILCEFVAERRRAHAKHGATSAESAGPYAHKRMSILTEEVGEVATELNDMDHAANHALDRHEAEVNLRKELVQTGAMVLAWIAAIDGHQLPVLPPLKRAPYPRAIRTPRPPRRAPVLSADSDSCADPTIPGSEDGAPRNECRESKRPCGHHCNCSWTQDCCHWCLAEFGEDGAVTFPDKHPNKNLSVAL